MWIWWWSLRFCVSVCRAWCPSTRAVMSDGCHRYSRCHGCLPGDFCLILLSLSPLMCQLAMCGCVWGNEVRLECVVIVRHECHSTLKNVNIFTYDAYRCCYLGMISRWLDNLPTVCVCCLAVDQICHLFNGCHFVGFLSPWTAGFTNMPVSYGLSQQCLREGGQCSKCDGVTSDRVAGDTST